MPPARTSRRNSNRYDPVAANNESKRGPWSSVEDDLLRELVAKHGVGKWVQIADGLITRSPKQCRERWHQNLKPELDHSPITPEEGATINMLVGSGGKRWADISRALVNRSDNAVKNWWNGGENRRRRELARQQEQAVRAASMQQFAPAVAHPAYPQGYYVPPPMTPIESVESLTLPPLHSLRARAAPPPLPLNLAATREHHVEAARPSPLDSRAPSLVSDVGSSPAHGHVHRLSFDLPTPTNFGLHYGAHAVDMRRSISSEQQAAAAASAWQSPAQQPARPYQAMPDYKAPAQLAYVPHPPAQATTLPSLHNLLGGSLLRETRESLQLPYVGSASRPQGGR